MITRAKTAQIADTFLQIALACALLASSGMLASCGGDGATFDGRRVVGPDTHYEIGDPGDDWQPLDVASNHVAWKNTVNPSSVIQVNARCDDSLDIPLAALRGHLLIGFTEREFHSEEVIQIDEREALQTYVGAKLDGVPRELDLIVLKKNGCVYDFSLIATTPEDRRDAQSAYKQVLKGFRAP